MRVDLATEVETAGRLVLALAVAGRLDADEALTVRGPAGPLASRPVAMPHDTRMHLVEAPVGRLEATYEATVRTTVARDAPVTDAERLTFSLPSRFCPSDRIGGWAANEFGTGDDAARVLRVVDWVFERTRYEAGTSGPTDDALTPLLTGAGVCRDYAHLVAAILRSLDIPARYVSVYAPGLSPMDAHAVVEAVVDGHWRMVDATRLAPRRSMVRVGTGRDAADVALLTTLGAFTTGPFELQVTATVDPDLPPEDPGALVALP
ncbi:transglutaminase family protein [Phycicoccus sp. BSK3Z-2]|uniref:Transglutaminase family protein n=1 Tax=Phycicoccus avicenniae TaxID=2828860 RepID=A0A941D788_9MICO|nr:transglutaminase family protein [Phycicoccus avicenniae]